MAQKIRDIVAKVGEYQDRNTGENKARWMNVGSLMKNDDDSIFIILDRTFNPAGLPNPENRGNCLLSCFVPQEKREGGQQQGSGGGYGVGEGNSDPARQAPPRDLGDEVPF